MNEKSVLNQRNLLPEDDYLHPPTAHLNYNESMYFNVFDHRQSLGGWFRLGNRPNEGYAEMSVCLYLPGGKTGFLFARPAIASTGTLEAGGMQIQILEPFSKWKVSYKGQLLLLSHPAEMVNPALAFQNNPQVNCELVLDFTGLSPVFGGISQDSVATEMNSFAKAHYEQFVAAEGAFLIDKDSFQINGLGLRDKSWGPRYWQALYWYRWLPMNFDKDFGLMVSLIGNKQGKVDKGGILWKEGKLDPVIDCTLKSEWDAEGYQKNIEIRVQTETGQNLLVKGEVQSLIPLRNKRILPEGEELQTRILEGMTLFECEGKKGYGMSEYLDQIIQQQAVQQAY